MAASNARSPLPAKPSATRRARKIGFCSEHRGEQELPRCRSSTMVDALGGPAGSPVPSPLSFAAREQGIAPGAIEMHDALVHRLGAMRGSHLAVRQADVFFAFEIHHATPTNYIRLAPAALAPARIARRRRADWRYDVVCCRREPPTSALSQTRAPNSDSHPGARRQGKTKHALDLLGAHAIWRAPSTATWRRDLGLG